MFQYTTPTHLEGNHWMKQLSNTCSACHSKTACSWWHCTPVLWQLTTSVKQLASKHKSFGYRVWKTNPQMWFAWMQRQWRLHTDTAALALSINSFKEFFLPGSMYGTACSYPSLWFSALQHKPVYFANYLRRWGMPKFSPVWMQYGYSWLETFVSDSQAKIQLINLNSNNQRTR